MSHHDRASGDDGPARDAPPEEAGRARATAHPVVARPRRAHRAVRRSAPLRERIRAVFDALPVEPSALSSRTQWLLDNDYLILRALRQTEDDMPRAYYATLPTLANGTPRVEALAGAIVAWSEHRLDLARVRRFVEGHQEVAPLTLGELWALPTFLRIVALESLAEAAPNAHEAARVEVEHDETLPATILSLHALDTHDWTAFVEATSLIERRLRQDPAGAYLRMDEATRDRYRATIERLAVRSGRSEEAVAAEAVALARSAAARPDGRPERAHVGAYLIGSAVSEFERTVGAPPTLRMHLERGARRWAAPLYAAATSLLAVLLIAATTAVALRWGARVEALALTAAVAVPAWVAAEAALRRLVTHLLPPTRLPKLELRAGVPPDARTLVAVPALFTSEAGIHDLFARIERHYLGHRDPRLAFVVLGDVPDAADRVVPEDAALLDRAEAELAALRARHPEGRFLLLTRERRWNASEGVWMGWERKRGKLTELNRLIVHGVRGGFLFHGDRAEAFAGFPFVITLDADTVLPPGSAFRLIGTLAHPLNRASFDAANRLRHGFTILQPRIEAHPDDADRTRFARLFSHGRTVDLYAHAVSEPYMDLFGEGIYAGKGIYDVAAFERTVGDVPPENAILSHDLLEGGLGRAGLVSDVVVLESQPQHYLAHARRLHRWIRGDWQLLPWAGRRVPGPEGRVPNPLSHTARWVLRQNLVRSLHPPSLLALFVVGWTVAPGPAWAWTGLALALSAAPLLQVPRALVRLARPRRAARLPHAADRDLLRWAVDLAFLAHAAWVAAAAVTTTLWRLRVSRRHLLRWTESSQDARDASRRRNALARWRAMSAAPLAATVVGALMLGARPEAWPVAVPFLLAWALSPQLAYLLDRPVPIQDRALTPERRRWLATIARRTWLYFERFIGPDDHWLPPDHFQESPRGEVAHRTSPTNVGLLLATTVGAHDAGYLGARDLLLRLGNTFATLDRLERHRGHFLNWYDTRTLRPLHPKYVSTVDSGNLLGLLVVVRQACLEVPDGTVLRWRRFDGLRTLADLLKETVETLEDDGELTRSIVAFRERIDRTEGRPERWSPLVDELASEALPELERTLLERVRTAAGGVGHERLADLGIWLGRLQQQLDTMRDGRDALLPWLRPDARVSALDPVVDEIPLQLAFRDLPAAYRTIREALDALAPANAVESARRTRLRSALDAADEVAERIRRDADAVAANAERILQETHVDFLFDTERKLFRIGYHVDDDREDVHAYDLLASEARIASFMAIALDRVAPEHWLHLGRPTALVDGRQVLLSWSGTMFEYLMPTLFMRTPERSLLAHACRTAIDRQIAFGRAHGVPWGTSESGYARTDAQENYQYRAFGVPDLALSHEATGRQVVAPYATLMALPWTPHEAAENLERLVAAGAMGRYGFYEALDYAHARLAPGERYTVVRSFMVHHHGMAFMALCNLLHDGRFVERFHADARVRTHEVLLYEGLAPGPPDERIERDERTEDPRPRFHAPPVEPWEVPVRTRSPEVHALSNGRYTLFMSNSGAGASRWEGLDLTRWRSDPTCDAWGQWIYVQDLDLDRTWSATPKPVDAPGQHPRVTFHPHQITFHRRDGDVTTRLEVIVPPQDDAEIRRVTLVNHGDSVRRLAVTSYGEVALAPHGDDLRHPAFAKMFVECSWRAEDDGLLFRRRLRSTTDAPAYLVHRLVHDRGAHPPPEIETDRERFLGRHGHPGDPAGLRATRLSGTLGATLDPVFALRTRVEIPAHATVRLSFVTAAGGSARTVLDVAHRYGRRDRIEAAFLDAAARQGQVAAQVGLDAAESASADRLLSRLLYPDAATRSDAAILRSNVSGPSGLWVHGISGDHPIVLLRLRTEEDVATVRTLLKIHRLWRSQRFVVDLVVLNELDRGYVQTTRDAVRRLVVAAGDEVWQDRPGGIFLLSSAQLDEAGRVLLQSAARVVVNVGDGFVLAPFPSAPEDGLPALAPSHHRPDAAPDTPPLPRPTDLLCDNGWGGFSPDGRAYVTYLQEQATPAPWINVLANPDFGCLISESGSSTTWSANSGENRLSPWSNDPVADPSGEVLYLRDEETTETWTPTPQPMPGGLPYLVRHGQGRTTFEHRSHGLDQRMEVFVLDDAPVKVVRLRLSNLLTRPRRITATYYLEWVLGHARETSATSVIPEYDADLGALLARNPFRDAYAGQVAFLAGNRSPHGVTSDRREFLGRDGSTRRPAALRRIGLSGRVEAGSDPCAALQLHVDLAAGASDEVVFLVGVGEDREEAKELVRRHRSSEAVALGLERVTEAWERRLGTIHVRTPDPSMDLMLNGWLLYQSLACRMWGRTGFYQSSGAFGFRDQLQDSMALLHVDPATARAQLLEAARHQFEEGDVLHWWLPHEGRGVRTRISDDLAWLPFVTAHYVDGSGDAAVLDERVPFLHAPELGPDEHERFDRFPATDESFPLYVHACRALERAATQGAHGLPLMQGGDWNDGMNRVGVEGRGESVWLAWFLIATLERFAPLCDARDEPHRAERYREQAGAYRRAIEAHAWDGDWYLRAFYDDGTPLGSHAGDDARIDAIAQAWSVLAGPTDPERSARAMASVHEHLVRDKDGLVLLLAPPFDRGRHDPGYIKGYPPGVRENGGQYTHAALWFAWACAASGDGDRAHDLFGRLNPLRHAADAASAARYRLEPYVVAADVYGVAPHAGRGGWSWYTGSAAWMYRLGVEAILGLRREGTSLAFEPCIPAAWPGFEIRYRYGATEYRIQVVNPDGATRGVVGLELDGVALPTLRLPLVDDGVARSAIVRMGASGASGPMGTAGAA